MHKKDVPLRPNLPTINAYNYNHSKYLVKILHTITDSIYSVKDSFSFVEEILETENNNYVMCSFDIVSLYTNIPLDET